MSELPKGWVQATLGEVTTKIGSGATPKGGEQSYKLSGIPLIRSLNVHFDGVREEGLAFLDEEQASKLDNVIVQEDDVLLNITGASIGRVAVAPSVYSGARVNQHVSIIRLVKDVVPQFVSSFLASPSAQDYITRENYGATRQALTKTMIEEFGFPLPPLAEQKRIVTTLDALNAKSARARTELARIETLLDQLRVVILQSAFKGKLTSDVERQSDAAKINTHSPAIELWSVPVDWLWCRTDQVGRVGLGRQRSPKNHEGPYMRPYLRSANITWQGIDTSDVKEMNFDAADFNRFKLEVGDVLLNEGSGSAKEVGKPAIWRGEIPDCCYQNTLLRVQPQQCSSEYLYYYFLLIARSGLFVSSTQGVNIQHIGREGLACYPVPLAPETEQQEIVCRIESGFAKIDRLAAEARRALDLVGKLDEAILAKAFRGDLVPQDENDEPADKLLERIRAEREAAPKVTSKRVKRETAMSTARDFLNTKLENWPVEGISFQDLRREFGGNYEDLKEAVFASLSDEGSTLQQVFDEKTSLMAIRKRS